MGLSEADLTLSPTVKANVGEGVELNSTGKVTISSQLEKLTGKPSEYIGSVVVNAFGGRFFEPASGRSVQAGVNLAL